MRSELLSALGFTGLPGTSSTRRGLQVRDQAVLLNGPVTVFSAVQKDYGETITVFAGHVGFVTDVDFAPRHARTFRDTPHRGSGFLAQMAVLRCDQNQSIHGVLSVSKSALGQRMIMPVSWGLGAASVAADRPGGSDDLERMNLLQMSHMWSVRRRTGPETICIRPITSNR